MHKGLVKLVTVAGASNITGYINPIHQIAQLAHQFNAEVLVDGAQLVPHAPVNMKPHSSPEHIDYLAFSAHKMYAPFGVGVLVGHKKTFEQGTPEYVGCTNAKSVTLHSVVWKDPPYKEEAGTANVLGILALDAAIKTLAQNGMKNIKQFESSLSQKVIEGLQTLSGLKIYMDPKHPRIGIIPFNVQGIPHDLLAKMLAQEAGVEVGNGYLAAQPYVEKLLQRKNELIQNYIGTYKPPHPGLVRISLGLYNSEEEIKKLIDILTQINADKSAYFDKYNPSK